MACVEYRPENGKNPYVVVLGDKFMISFSTPAGAVLCAEDPDILELERDIVINGVADGDELAAAYA